MSRTATHMFYGNQIQFLNLIQLNILSVHFKIARENYIGMIVHCHIVVVESKFI